VSGGGGPFLAGHRGDRQNPVEVAPEAAPVAPPADELDQPELLQEVQVALDRACGAAEDPGQRLHLGPAQAVLVVGVVGQGAVGGDRLHRYAGEHEMLDLGYAGESGLRRHNNLLGSCGGCALAIWDGKIRQSGGASAKGSARRFFYAFFSLGANLTESRTPGLV